MAQGYHTGKSTTIYREMLKKYSYQELLGPFQANLVRNIFGMGIQICSNQGLAPLGSQ